MIDTHCHLSDPRLLSQLPEVLARAKAAGVERMIAIGTDLEDDQATIALCKKFDHIRCAVGVHPNNAGGATLADIERLRTLQNDSTVLALGEMGLDYNHKDVPADHQRVMFEAQMQLAREVK